VYRRALAAMQFFRLEKDNSDIQPVIMEAYRALNLIGS
jgi:hypothetical protein